MYSWIRHWMCWRINWSPKHWLRFRRVERAIFWEMAPAFCLSAAIAIASMSIGRFWFQSPWWESMSNGIKTDSGYSIGFLLPTVLKDALGICDLLTKKTAIVNSLWWGMYEFHGVKVGVQYWGKRISTWTGCFRYKVAPKPLPLAQVITWGGCTSWFKQVVWVYIHGGGYSLRPEMTAIDSCHHGYVIYLVT